ncbi:hypothetical protein ETF27_07575 [Prevotella brunnea]|uniref:Uncharacterized protein n=1 Tax=Prevotella brunnea TaxID=2508867 RepID=A0A5C8GG43_9BACT|nr:hypothetical protein [Prevotella brunnea]MDR0186643.1 hypothetical protein [Prevotella brunnea]TXJ60945.1 hypothetical protein ETF27_07575 [Prevotella brunnea]
MATHPLWSDEYWLLLLQVYLREPVGMKPMYSRNLVKVSLELHIPPHYLYEQQFLLRQRGTPVIQLIWDTYAENPKKLKRDVKRLREMKGFGNSTLFYKDVDEKHTFETDFLPLPQNKALKPVMLIMILELYFRLTPITMAEATPEVRELAKMMRLSTRLIVEIMDVFRFCDPYLNRDDLLISPLLPPCQEIWNRYGNDNPQKLSALAAQLRDYFR